MYVVSNTYFLRNLRNLDFFTLDLGQSRKIVNKENEFRKLDEFTIKYKNLYNKDIFKFGNIANKITFYEDFLLENNMYIIFKDEDIYEITYTKEDIMDLKNYILETLRKIDSYEEESRELNEKNEKKSQENINDTDGWVANDDKNGKKRYVINQKLSKEDYRKEMENLFYSKK